MSVDFTPLFNYMDERFAEVNERFDRVENRLDNVEKSVDGLSKHVVTFQHKMAIICMKTGRIESWIQLAAKKLEIPYNT